MLRELERIDRYRLDHDLTWAELAAEMVRARLPLAANTLHYHVKIAPDSVPHDRTLHKIRKFLKRRVTRRRPTRTAATPAPPVTPTA